MIAEARQTARRWRSDDQARDGAGAGHVKLAAPAHEMAQEEILKQLAFLSPASRRRFDAGGEVLEFEAPADEAEELRRRRRAGAQDAARPALAQRKVVFRSPAADRPAFPGRCPRLARTGRPGTGRPGRVVAGAVPILRSRVRGHGRGVGPSADADADADPHRRAGEVRLLSLVPAQRDVRVRTSPRTRRSRRVPARHRDAADARDATRWATW